jgi:hypothetical protein
LAQGRFPFSFGPGTFAVAGATEVCGNIDADSVAIDL